MRYLERNNFLHYGDALERLKHFDFSTFEEDIQKIDLMDSIRRQEVHSKYVDEIVQCYGFRRSKKINVLKFKRDLSDSLKCRRDFMQLGCRGFSYYFVDGMEWFPFRLRKEINLRLALMSAGDLFYPPKVRRYLRRDLMNHYTVDGYPSIAFALGSEIGKDWYISVIQSDLVFKRPAALREHFRGWRKILFTQIVNCAKGRADNIFLCTSQDVFKCCHPAFLRPDNLPNNWKIIYDGTAGFFDMKRTRKTQKVNIQIFSKAKAVYANQFFKLNFKKLSS